MRRLLLLALVFACSPAPTTPPPGGIDLHLHCFPTTTCDGIPCCDLSRWNAAMGDRSDVGGVLLSLQHFSVLQKLGGLPEAQAFIPRQNETVKLHATKTPTVAWFSSLPCWSEERWGPTWLTRCQADVDAQLGQGAKGFKDHTGKSCTGSARGTGSTAPAPASPQTRTRTASASRRRAPASPASSPTTRRW